MRGAHRRGVHAWGQVVSFPSPPGLDPWQLASRGHVDARARGRRPVVRARRTRRSTRGTRRSGAQYRYTIVNRPVPDPFRDRFAWWVPEPLDLRALRLAADPFVGDHDFASFCRKGPRGLDDDAQVLESSWVDHGDGVLRYEIRAGRVLLADGAVDRRHARRGRCRAGAGRARCSASSRAAIAPPPASSRRRAACASGTSATDARAVARRPASVSRRRRWASRSAPDP